MPLNSLRALLILIISGLLNLASAAQTQSASLQADFQARLTRMERMLEEKRLETGVPGMAVAIVKDNQIVFIKGFGVRDAEKKLPVTTETLFPIGSSTKAFTGMLMAMSADDGKLAFNDSPKKYLPFFKLQDAEADRKITLRDLMIHDSGLGRTELIWYPGVLSRQEVIRAAGEVKPTAPFGEKFQYQNIMVTAAGEAVAKAQNSTWERLMRERIFKPLGMEKTVLALPALMRSNDYALGYTYDEKTKAAVRTPFRSESAVSSIAPAGSVYSNAQDMANWVRFIIGGGAFGGKRLVSEKNFNETVAAQMKNIGGSDVGYGLGWFVLNRKGHRIVQHGGSIDGFRAEVSLMPDERLGFVILTNSYKTPLVAPDTGGSGLAEEIIWSNLVDESPMQNEATNSGNANPENAAQNGSAQQEVGKYALASLTVEITMTDGKLILNVPNQASYPLENIGGRRYKFAGDSPAVADHFVTFRPSADGGGKTEIFLEQPPPKRNLVFTKINSEAAVSPTGTADNGGGKKYEELTGNYEAEIEGKPVTFQLVIQDGKLSVLRPGQRSLALVEKSKDNFSIAGAPDTYEINVKRNAAGEVSGLSVKQPNGNYELNRRADFKSPLSTEELMTKIIAALGGEANLRKHKTLVTTFDINLPNQGLTGTGTINEKAPNLKTTETIFFALGKRLGNLREYFDGQNGGTESSFLPATTKNGTEIRQARITADFYAPLDWRANYKTIEITGITKIEGEDEFIVVKTPEAGGAPETDYISTKSYLLVRRDSPAGITNFSDYREIDGLMLPFKWTIENSSLGEQIVTVKSAKFDAPVTDDLFTGKQKKD